MTEVLVKFRDGFVVTYPPCETGIVAYARAAAWIGRFPAARTREFSERRETQLYDQKSGELTGSKAERTIMVIAIDIPEAASKEVRELVAVF